MLQFFKKQRLHTQKSFQKEYILYKFQIKIYLESFVSIYHLYHLFAISTKLCSTTWTSHWITVSSVKPSISGVTFLENVLWVPGTLMSDKVQTNSQITIFQISSCIFVLKCFSVALIPWYIFPFCTVIIVGYI